MAKTRNKTYTLRKTTSLKRCLDTEFLWYSLSSSYEKESPKSYYRNMKRNIYNIKGNLANQSNKEKTLGENLSRHKFAIGRRRNSAS